MPFKHLKGYRDPAISREIIESIKKLSKKEVRLMEVCGTHTMTIFKSGIKRLLPETISLLSGPGCPVCVTSRHEIDTVIEIARAKDVIVVTFGDLLRVPGSFSSLQKERANGKDIHVVYSAFDGLEIAKKNPDKKIVFLGIGFETTAPTIAASILSADNLRLDNYFVLSVHKLIPPALAALMQIKGVRVDGFILPGHVSVIIGTNAFLPFFGQYQIPCVVAGFEPIDMLQAIFMLVKQIEAGSASLENGYQRAVTIEGNKKAKKIMQDVFETVDVTWRGIGTIPKSGLKIREKFSYLDAQKMFDISIPHSEDPKG